MRWSSLCRKSRIRRSAGECILYSHDELNVRMIIDQTEVYELPRAINVRKVEHFDLRQNSMLLHLSRKALNEGCRVFVDDGREIH